MRPVLRARSALLIGFPGFLFAAMTAQPKSASRPALGQAAEWADPKSLRPWEKNPRRNRAAVAKVKLSISKFGFASPIVARRADREVIAGHTRLLAALELGLTEVPVRFVDLGAKEAHELAVVDNRTTEFADWDDDALADIVQDFDDETKAILDDLATEDDSVREPLQVEEIQTSHLESTFWLTVRGPLSKQPDALAALRQSLEALGPDVEVDVGVV